ncbi:hypothetical protein CR513_38661, partial [Mucuna pruriens]
MNPKKPKKTLPLPLPHQDLRPGKHGPNLSIIATPLQLAKGNYQVIGVLGHPVSPTLKDSHLKDLLTNLEVQFIPKGVFLTRHPTITGEV